MSAPENQKFRIGSVPYLNAAPLTRGIESELIFATPAKLAQLLRRDELDAALVSVTEVLLNDRYDILDGIAIASLGEVYSVLLAHKKPLAEVTEVFCDTASLTSVNLLKVLLAERGLKPEFKPLENYAAAPEKDFVLIIGDPAIDFQRAPHTHEINAANKAIRRSRRASPINGIPVGASPTNTARSPCAVTRPASPPTHDNSSDSVRA